MRRRGHDDDNAYIECKHGDALHFLAELHRDRYLGDDGNAERHHDDLHGRFRRQRCLDKGAAPGQQYAGCLHLKLHYDDVYGNATVHTDDPCQWILDHQQHDGCYRAL